jgi:hypothetical protein
VRLSAYLAIPLPAAKAVGFSSGTRKGRKSAPALRTDIQNKKTLSSAVSDAYLKSKGCLPRVLEMPVIPLKVPALTVVLGILYCVRKHQSNP